MKRWHELTEIDFVTMSSEELRQIKMNTMHGEQHVLDEMRANESSSNHDNGELDIHSMEFLRQT